MYAGIRTLHFVGIGGIGMSGIAEVLLNLGYRITGSDLSENANVLRLRSLGARIQKGHSAEQVEGADAIVISSAVTPDNPEVMAARAHRIPVVRRAEMLAELMRLKRGVAIAGTHGKTTTTSLTAALLDEAGMDPTVVNGGIVKALGSNARHGEGEFLVTEADESDGSFLKLTPTIAVVTNMDPEHMEHYGDFNAVRDAFLQFVSKIPFYGLAVLCQDHPETAALARKLADKRVITYGLDEAADVRAVDIRQEGVRTHFTVRRQDPQCGAVETFGPITLTLPGRHNVANTLAAIACARELAVPWPVIARTLSRFKGVQRRFDLLHEAADLVVIDDYGHHPVEIAATLEAVRAGYPNRRLTAVFQPHRFSRVRDHLEEFQSCFKQADLVLVDAIYRAGETPPEGPIGERGQELLMEGIAERSGAPTLPLPADHAWGRDLDGALQAGDVLVFLGAGDISARARQFAAGLTV
ncbi:UDP-N-acetylmuramate--L-alanine ligase [Magnetofaba australis]|uniref:UDP-N-acetylmuramate--L-alanine ligase n=1 Tax=Magnetofaba australis IT-1 TaxID=1434232 RepID=A0A1Y2K8V1_9PROT|nr:UDP-N-acetylmuramate--L-alanine ligase [Magnetofaba australis]OSM07059.1 putative UDP-N-acetylmuramate--L-alanine ligase [Magnetofaba australis IT-1]